MDFKNINNYLNFNNSSDSIDNINKPKLIEPGVKYFFKGIYFYFNLLIKSLILKN